MKKNKEQLFKVWLVVLLVIFNVCSAAEESDGSRLERFEKSTRKVENNSESKWLGVAGAFFTGKIVADKVSGKENENPRTKEIEPTKENIEKLYLFNQRLGRVQFAYGSSSNGEDPENKIDGYEHYFKYKLAKGLGFFYQNRILKEGDFALQNTKTLLELRAPAILMPADNIVQLGAVLGAKRIRGNESIQGVCYGVNYNQYNKSLNTSFHLNYYATLFNLKDEIISSEIDLYQRFYLGFLLLDIGGVAEFTDIQNDVAWSQFYLRGGFVF